uniref:HDC12487 n=1 Tax=Drosophila melanogaster TaxID=7227 RepID=Q6IKG9_DROME|nr:TPA_inf: HDC12487 [Drosophila melanogaster]
MERSQHLGKCSRANNCWNTDLVAASKAKQTRPPKVKWVKGMEGVKKGGPQSHRLAEQQSRYRWSLIRRKSVWPPPDRHLRESSHVTCILIKDVTASAAHLAIWPPSRMATCHFCHSNATPLHAAPLRHLNVIVLARCHGPLMLRWPLLPVTLSLTAKCPPLTSYYEFPTDQMGGVTQSLLGIPSTAAVSPISNMPPLLVLRQSVVKCALFPMSLNGIDCDSPWQDEATSCRSHRRWNTE